MQRKKSKILGINTEMTLSDVFQQRKNGFPKSSFQRWIPRSSEGMISSNPNFLGDGKAGDVRHSSVPWIRGGIFGLDHLRGLFQPQLFPKAAVDGDNPFLRSWQGRNVWIVGFARLSIQLQRASKSSKERQSSDHSLTIKPSLN